MAKAPTLSALLAQKAALDKQIAGFQSQQRSEAIAKVKLMMSEYGLTAADLGGAVGKPGVKTAPKSNGAAKAGKGDASGSSSAANSAANGSGNGDAPAAASGKTKRKSANAGKKVAPKFRNPATGDTWSGRGLKPKWLSAAMASGRDISEFAI